MTSERFDLVVIGAGPAGEKAGAQVAYFGRHVAIVDRRPDPGGSAASKTGVPTKTLREAALYLTGFRRRNLYGTGMDLSPEAILELMRERTTEVVKLSVDAVRENLDRHGIELIQGEARLGPDRTVLVTTPTGPRALQGEVVLIATGSRPFHPPGVPFDDPDVHDSESILELERVPRRFVVVGGGPVGCEYASIFLALGAEVTMIDRGPRVLPLADAEVSEALAGVFREHGMTLLQETNVTGTERIGGDLTLRLSDQRTIVADAVLFASGRAGTTEGIGLEEAGVRTDQRGRIVVDETYRTTAEGIYAAGDVIGPPGLASAAMEQGRVAACHAFGIPFKETVDPLAPLGVYSIPEVGMVGMTEEAAREAGIDVESGRSLFEANARARIAGTTDGLVKLVFEREGRRLLGVHIVGDDASELIHIGQGALHAGATIDYFIHSTFSVPTLSEAYKYAAYDGLQRLARHGS
jgi:NAD(P) transhydrogenase